MPEPAVLTYQPVPIGEVALSAKRGPKFLKLGEGVIATRFDDVGFEYLVTRGPSTATTKLVIELLPDGNLSCRRYHVRGAPSCVVSRDQLLSWMRGDPVPNLPALVPLSNCSRRRHRMVGAERG